MPLWQTRYSLQAILERPSLRSKRFDQEPLETIYLDSAKQETPIELYQLNGVLLETSPRALVMDLTENKSYSLQIGIDSGVGQFWRAVKEPPKIPKYPYASP